MKYIPNPERSISVRDPLTGVEITEVDLETCDFDRKMAYLRIIEEKDLIPAPEAKAKAIKKSEKED
jgi:hypothetical protein